MSQYTINALIADDHPVIRGGLRNIFKEHFDAKVYEATNGDELIELVKKHEFNVVIMDLGMPNTNPQSIIQNMLIVKPKLNIIIFSMNKEEVFGKLYLQMGVMAYLQKGIEESEIVKAIHCVMGGNVYISKAMQGFYIGTKANRAAFNPFAVLSKKEMELLPHLANGDSVMGIARMMNLSPSTIGTHKSNIFTKLQISNIYELMELVNLHPLL